MPFQLLGYFHQAPTGLTTSHSRPHAAGNARPGTAQSRQAGHTGQRICHSPHRRPVEQGLLPSEDPQGHAARNLCLWHRKTRFLDRPARRYDDFHLLRVPVRRRSACPRSFDRPGNRRAFGSVRHQGRPSNPP